MALTHLVDASVISRLREVSVRSVVGPLAEQGRVGRAGITDLEVGYGSRNASEWDQDMADLSVFTLVETTAEHVQRARQIQRLWHHAVSADERCPICSSPLPRKTHASSCSITIRTSI